MSAHAPASKMARAHKISVKDASAFDLSLNLTQSKIKKYRRTPTASNYTVNIDAQNDASEEHTPPRHIPQRVFLYLQLQSIVNLPESDNKLSIRLQHKNQITKLDDHYTPSTEIDPYDLDTKPTFSITINQDSSDDLNVFSDNPLIITIYEQVPTILSSEEGEDIVFEEPIAQGVIDLLPFFTKYRSITNLETFLYPTAEKQINPAGGTCKTAWQIYSLLPLLKDLTFCNIVFITFESIYNASTELLSMSNELSADISLKPTMPDENAEDARIRVCTFSSFADTVIDEQDYNHKWESVVQGAQSEAHTLAAQAGCRINEVKLFRDLVCEEDVNYKFDEISIGDDVALIANTMRRFVLTQHISTLLEEAVAFNEHQLLIEIFNRENPDEILLSGTVDLSIFLYPKVNACRFAVTLTQPVQDQDISRKSKKENPEIRTKGSIDSLMGESPVFAILNICLLMPITETCGKMTLFSLKKFDPEKLKLCFELRPESVPKTAKQICDEAYKRFDEQIAHLIDKILDKKMKTVDDAKKMLCCHKDELVNKITKLVSCDFNSRFPTDTNIKFTNLMTVVYKELEQRIYNTLLKCSTNWEQQFCFPNQNIETKVRMFITLIKMLNEAGDTKLASFLLEKTKAFCVNLTSISFYEFLYSVEKQNFEEAKLYLAKPLSERHVCCEYFATLIAIYIDYATLLQTEQYYNQALQYLLNALEKFSKTHPREIAVWILLHCLYKSCKYLPGTAFTRWKYENLPVAPYMKLPQLPISLWEIYNSYDLNISSPTGIKYCNALKLFLQLGLYKFAMIVYENIERECSKAEKYFMTSTLNILLDELPENYDIPAATLDGSKDVELTQVYQAFINGHLQYHRGATISAMSYYEKLLKQTRIPFGRIQLGLLRYGYYMAECRKGVQAIVAFQASGTTKVYHLIANYNLGKALYSLNRLKEAEQHFAKCTIHGMHIPDVWAYLALVNIKMNKPVNALESWKYAYINPLNVISAEIINELHTIDHSKLSLYVDNCII